jgi:hypothetical protein
MFKIRFISAHLWLVLILGTVFIKIYQYNLYIKTTYEHQRLGRCFALLEKERNELLVCLYEQQQPIQLMAEGEKQGMLAVPLEAIITTTQVALVDFVGTASTVSVLAQCGIPVILPAQPARRKNIQKSVRSKTDLAMIADRLSSLDTWLSVDAPRWAENEQNSFDALASLSSFIIEKV